MMLLKLEGCGPLYTRVYSTLRRRIVEGVFKPGERLPGTRSAASALGVSRTVVLLAYAQLESEGYTTTRVGSGTFVSEGNIAGDHDDAAATPVSTKRLPAVPLSRLASRVTHSAAEDNPTGLLQGAIEIVDLTDEGARYDARGLKAWRRAMIQTIGNLPTEPPGVAGVPALRKAMLNYLQRERGVVADIEDVVIVSSAQQARDLIARVLVDEGTVVGMEDPCDPGARHAFAASGGRIVACSVDDNGFDIQAHAASLRDATVVHVAPSCQFPTGVAMSQQRRAALLEWAYARLAYIVEDDSDSDHRQGVRVTPALQGMGRHERVIYYMSSFARSLYPALQLGCVVVPPELREKFHALRWLSDHDGMSMGQHAWARYIANGEYTRSLRRQSKQLAHKHADLVRALKHYLGPGIELHGPATSGQLLVHLPELAIGWGTVLREEALRGGLLLQSGEPWYAKPQPHVTLMLNYSGTPEANLDIAAQRLAHAYRTAMADVGRSVPAAAAR